MCVQECNRYMHVSTWSNIHKSRQHCILKAMNKKYKFLELCIINNNREMMKYTSCLFSLLILCRVFLALNYSLVDYNYHNNNKFKGMK